MSVHRGGLRCQPEHLGAERAQHQLGQFLGAVSKEWCLAHASQVLAHVADGARILVMTEVLHQLPMADPEPQEEAARMRLLDGALGVGHRHRVAGVDVGDARRDRDGVGALKQQGGHHERVPTDRLRNPNGAVAQLLHLSGEFNSTHRGHLVQHRGPDPDPSHVRVSGSHGSQPTALDHAGPMCAPLSLATALVRTLIGSDPGGEHTMNVAGRRDVIRHVLVAEIRTKGRLASPRRRTRAPGRSCAWCSVRCAGTPLCRVTRLSC